MRRRDPYEVGNARARHNRAGEHLSDIEVAIAAFEAKNPYRLPASSYEDVYPPFMDQVEPKEAGGFWFVGVTPPRDLSIRVGEMVYNLRAAMDYLVYSLARHDSGRIEKRTQFPIENGEKGFRGRRNSFLKGVADEHVAMIEDYQPYKGCDWTARLREISNADKHRTLTILAGGWDTYTGDWIEHWRSRAAPDTDSDTAEPRMHVDIDATLNVVFDNGTRVAETLQELQSQVGLLLKAFSRRFKYLPIE